MSGLDGLLGNGEQIQCRVVSDDVSVHWWRNDDSGLCLCGDTRKLATGEREVSAEYACRHDWMRLGYPGGAYRECFLCGRQED